MNIQQYREKLVQAKQQIIAALPRIAEESAVSTLALVKDRSTNEGITADGEKKQYSTRLVSTSLFSGKELNAAGASYISANEKGTWGKFRAAQGREGETVNLAYTMRMWTGIQVIQVNQVEPGKYETVIGAADQETRDKIEQNTARYGRFFDPLPEEAQMFNDIARERLQEIIKGI